MNDPKMPRFNVRMVIKEYGGERLLVLQRESEAKGRGVPLHLPYGRVSDAPKDERDYSSISLGAR